MFFYCKSLTLTIIWSRQDPEFDGQVNLALNSTGIVKLNIVLLCSVQYQHNLCPKKKNQNPNRLTKDKKNVRRFA